MVDDKGSDRKAFTAGAGQVFRRPITAAPVQRQPVPPAPRQAPPTELRPVSQAQSKPNKTNRAILPKRLAKRQVIITSAVLLIAIVGGLIYSLKPAPKPYPTAITQKVHVALYYPTHNLPDGMQVDTGSFKIPATNVVTYTVSDAQAKNFYVSVQPLPSSFDFTSFEAGFQNTKQFSSPAGNTFIGSNNTMLLASIQTPQKSWIIITTSTNNPQSELEAFAQSFTGVQL